MTEPQPAPERKPDTTDYAHRRRVNIIAAVGLTALVAGSIYAVKLFYEHEKLNTCIASGRRNCVDLNLPPREGVYIPTR
jgi:hypothetical protein